MVGKSLVKSLIRGVDNLWYLEISPKSAKYWWHYCTKSKFITQPSYVPLKNVQLKKAPCWTNKIFHFGSENGEEQSQYITYINVTDHDQPKAFFQDCSLNLFSAIFKRKTSASKSQIAFVPWFRNVREKNNISKRNCSIVIWFESLYRTGEVGSNSE